MTYYLQDMCCLCLKVANLSDFNSGQNEWTSYDKILSSLTRIANFLETNFDYKICNKCTETAEMIYNFNESCIKNIKTLSSYKNILTENGEKKRCTLRVALKKLESTENTITELVSVKTEIKDETLSECDTFEENFSNFVPVKVKEETEENPIFDDELKIDRINEVQFKTEIEDITLKNEFYFEINDKDIFGLETQNIQTRIGTNIELPSTSKLNAPFTSTNQSEETQVMKPEQVYQIDDTSIQGSIINNEDPHSNDTYPKDKPYKRLNDLKNNDRVKPFNCNVCQKIFRLKSSLRRHLLTHNNENPHVCNICDKVFSCKSYLRSHMLTHNSGNPHVCNICNKVFSCKSYLERHILIHPSENPYVCDICHKVLSCKANLNSHRLIHSEVKPFSCPDCDKTYTQKSHLEVHQRTHTGEKYVCDVCGKAYTQKQHLNNHMRTHTGEKPHVCDVCNKAFLQKKYLTEHRRIHTGETPFVCDVCNIAFRVRSMLRKHRKLHVI